MGVDNPAWHTQQQSAKETSSQEAQLDWEQQFRGVSGGTVITAEIYDNTSSNRHLAEMIGIAQDGNITDEVRYTVQVNDGTGSPTAEMDVNPPHLPLMFDPALPVEPGGEIDLRIENFSTTDIDVVATTLVRFIA